jgi:integrase
MAHVRPVQRKTGTAYEVRWRSGDTFKQRTFTVKREAERFALTVENTKSSGDSTEPLAGRSQTFAQVVEASLAASKPRLKPGTYMGYVLLYDSRILPRFGKQRIAAVTSQQVEEWLADLTAEGLAGSTIRNHYVALSKVFKYAMRHRLVNHNPCDAVELPRARNADSFEAVFLTPAQVETIAAELDEHHHLGTLIRFAAQTGLRSAEIAGLRIRDVNLAAGHIEVRQTVKRLAGVWTVGTPKSARSTRNVPLFLGALTSELRLLLLQHPDSGNPDALFWPGQANRSRKLDWSQPLDVGRVRRYYLVPAARRLGIAPHMRFHDLRHTYASMMFAAEVDPYEVSRYMGHASIAITDGVYAHMYPSRNKPNATKFEKFYGTSD